MSAAAPSSTVLIEGTYPIPKCNCYPNSNHVHNFDPDTKPSPNLNSNSKVLSLGGWGGYATPH